MGDKLEYGEQSKIPLIGVVGYTILFGGDAALVRAAIIGGTDVFGFLAGRRLIGLNIPEIVVSVIAEFNFH